MGPMIPKVISYVGTKKQAVFVKKGMDEIEYYNLLIDNGHILTCPLIVNKKEQAVEAWMVPDPDHKGEDYDRWKDYICSLGYGVETKLLNCADFGVPQHRIRLIMQFTTNGTKARWPVKTHDKKGKHGLPKWMPVKDCLDLEDEGDSVLAFKMEKGVLVPRIESDATIDRLINGALKHVLPQRDAGVWIYKQNSAKNNTDVSSGASVEESGPTVACYGGLNLATAHLVDHYYGNGYVKPITEPGGVTGTKDGAALHTLHYLTQHYTGDDNSKNIPLENASRCITATGGNLGLVSAQCLGTYHSTGDGSSIESPSPAVMTKDKYPLFTAHFIDQQHTQGQKNKSIEEPNNAVLGNPKQKIVEVTAFVMDTQFNNIGHSVEDTAKTVTANRKHYYLVNFQWFNESFHSIDNPSNTIIARLDKTPNYLITLETGELAIEVFENDPPHYVRLKKFMAENGIIKINMRMLKDVELLRIMTIPDTTLLSKSSTANKKMIGNAVPSKLVAMLGNAWSDAA